MSDLIFGRITAGEKQTVKEHYRVFTRLVALKNWEVINEGRKTEDMKMTWKELIREDVEEEVQATKASDIKNVMESFGVTIEKAMETLKIPQEQWAMYTGLVNDRK